MTDGHPHSLGASHTHILQRLFSTISSGSFSKGGVVPSTSARAWTAAQHGSGHHSMMESGRSTPNLMTDEAMQMHGLNHHTFCGKPKELRCFVLNRIKPKKTPAFANITPTKPAVDRHGTPCP